MDTQTTLDANMVEQEAELIPASGSKRFLNFVIDTIAYYALCIVGAVILQLTGNEFHNERFLTIFCLLVMFLYFTLFEGLTGRTVGKMLTRTRVVNLAGEDISVTKAAGRSLCRFIPFEPFSFLGGSNSGWHDTMTGTMVIRKR